MIRPEKIFIIFLLEFLFLQNIFPSLQEMIVISGTVRNSDGSPLENAAVIINGTATGTYTGNNGGFSLRVINDGREHQLTVSITGYEPKTITVAFFGNYDCGDIIIKEKITPVGEITVTAPGKYVAPSAIKLSPEDFSFLPSASGSFEAVLKTLPGVSSNNELSSQYSVRGGNYDENLVYVNDIEIFRPFLVRSGQQEGLSFINPDLVASVFFSSGGFGLQYGDKMSSVLDITYKRPSGTKGSVSAGLLHNSAHYEGTGRKGNITWLSGIRYKSGSMMLNTLDSKGNYRPVFGDLQTLVTISTGKKSELSIFGSFSSNTYNFIPQSRESRFGSETEAYRLFVLFEGREKDRYEAWNSAITWKFFNYRTTQKIIFSIFGTVEKENFDIRGYYNLSTLDKNTGTENFSDTSMNIGTGSFLSHARNRADAGIFSLSYKGETRTGKTGFRWGLKIRNENISDNIREWKMVDSAGYSLPYNTGESLVISSLKNGNNSVKNILAEAYGDAEAVIIYGRKKFSFTGGTRGTYNSFTGELIASPRLSIKMETGKNLTAWIASGVYVQPPFYREMRYPDGSLNRNIKSQKSLHYVAGTSWNFRAWERPFRFTAEVYNKSLDKIIPYRLDNVRIVYEGSNMASGYSRGIELRLNGEFVEDAESWFSLSVMDSKLNIPELSGKMFPSPSDQRLNVNIFFQDYLPGNPTFRAHVTIAFVTGLPVISPFNNRYDQYHRMPAYRRVDLGITKVFTNRGYGRNCNPVKEVIAGMEVFNLLDINNTVSYFWVKTVNNQSSRSRQFAIPDYLTGRSLNMKLSALF